MATTYAEDIMRIALAEVGTSEKPANSNNVKYNTWFYNRVVHGSNYPWCCAFVNWVFDKAGANYLFYDGKKTAGTQTLEAWGIKKKLKVPKGDGRYGDIVLFGFGKSYVHHVGFIIKKNADGTYQTVEGNTSRTSDDNGGSVMIRTRRQSDINTILRPAYNLHPLIKVKGSTRKWAKEDVKSKTLDKFTSNDKVRWVKDMKNGWSQVISLADGEIGYMKNTKLNKVGLTGWKTAKIKKSAAFRANNSIKAKKLRKANFAVGTEIKIVTKRKNWTHVIYKGEGGYVATKKIKF